MNQLIFDLNLGPVVNPTSLFWCCGNCISVNDGRMSLTWLPPDHRRGRCEHCGRIFTFDSKYGEEELIAAGGKT